MESPSPPNPNRLPSVLVRCLLLTVCVVGCADPNEPISALGGNVGKEVLVGHAETDIESGERPPESFVREQSDSRSSPPHGSQSPSPSNSKRSAADRDKRPPIMAVQTCDATAYGVPIGLFSDQTLLMRNDGAIQRINTPDIIRHTVLPDRFKPIERTELAQLLRAEFGRNYIVKSDPPYMLVAKTEHMDVWQKRFKSLFHSFRLYCNTHGLTTREIEFPLVAVVFGSHDEFLRYATSKAMRANLPENCAGYYFSDSNRIVLYESSDMSIQETQATICHEATHQLAFNVGLHQRSSNVPLWVIEGLATMFESPMFSGLQSREGKSQWPASKRHHIEGLCKKPELFQNLLTGLVLNDKAFKNDTINAYCVAWAMTTYLSQRSPQQYSSYLLKGGSMEPFQEYAASQRVSDFQKAFGSDPRMLTKKIIQFLDNLE